MNKIGLEHVRTSGESGFYYSEYPVSVNNFISIHDLLEKKCMFFGQLGDLYNVVNKKTNNRQKTLLTGFCTVNNALDN